MSDADRTTWMGNLTLKAVYRVVGRRRPKKGDSASTSVEIAGAFAAVVYWEGADKGIVTDAVGKLLVALCRWCHARGVDPQAALERYWEEERTKL